MPVIAMLVAVLIWGGSFIATKAAVADLPPIAFALLRFSVATLSLLVVLGVRRQRLEVPRELWDRVVVAGLLGTTATYVLENWALRFTTAGNSALFLAFSPLVTVLGAVVLLKEPFSWRLGVGALLACVGLVAMLGASFGQTGLGDALMALNMLVGAAFGLVSKKLADRLDPLVALTATFGVGTLGLVPCAAIEALWVSGSWQMTPTVWGALLYLGLGSSSLAYWLWMYALGRMAVSEVGMFLYLMPVVTLFLSARLLGETLSWAKLAEASMILVGVWLANSARQVRGRAAASSPAEPAMAMEKGT